MTGIRGQFSSRLGFILAAAGSAVGIGNLVAFPVVATKNGGGAFLVIYIAFVALICFPVMLGEIAMGRASNKNPVGAFYALSGGNKIWGRLGGLAILTPFMIAVFYSVITIWIMLYMLQSAAGNLDRLAEPTAFGEIVSSPTLFIYMVITITIVFFILAGGVKGGIEKAAKILMPTLMVMLIALVLFVLTLDNAVAGLRYYLIPDFSLINSTVFRSALNHAFFSLSLGMGILITYGSYFSRKEKIVNATRLVAVMDTSVAFIAGLLILPAIFAMNPNVDVQTLSESSVSLIFSYLPQVFLEMESIVGYTGASILATFFFMLVLFAAMTSLVSISEIPIAWMIDEKEYSRQKALAMMGLGAGVFIILASMSLGMVDRLSTIATYGGVNKSFFDVIYDLFYDTILPLIGFLVCIFCSYRWKRSDFMNEVGEGDESYTTSLLASYVNLSLGTFIPVFLLLVFANNVAQIYFGYNLLGF
jgi:neurotransmitter:Na+ symporter, NSS family